MKPFVPGDRVKLTDKAARGHMRPERRTANRNINWKTRSGVVSDLNSYMVYVKWDGTTSNQTVPIGALEKAARQ